MQKLDKELEEALAKMESEQNAAIGGLDEKVRVCQLDCCNTYSCNRDMRYC